jgi:hypothetical protein
VKDDLVKERAYRQADANHRSGDHRVPSAVTGNASPASGTSQSAIAKRATEHIVHSVAHLSHSVLAQQGVGGPAGAAAGGAFGGAPPIANDYGPDLIDLIQTVIAPATWERNGGPGSIYYYRPLRVLVIRQTGEVHDEIGGTIEALRRVGN